MASKEEVDLSHSHTHHSLALPCYYLARKISQVLKQAGVGFEAATGCISKLIFLFTCLSAFQLCCGWSPDYGGHSSEGKAQGKWLASPSLSQNLP